MNDIINITFILVIALGIVISYFSSIRKQTYKSIMLLILFTTGWLLIPSLSILLNSIHFPKSLQITILNIKLESIPDFTSQLLNKLVDSSISSTTIYQSLIPEVTLMTSRLLSYIIWIFFIMPILFFTITLIVDKKIILKKEIEKSKKVLFLRLSFGVIQTLLILFFFFIPICGLLEIYSGVSRIQNKNDIQNYRDTLPGYLYGTFEKDGKAIDEYFFDKIVYINYQNEQIEVRKDFNLGVEVFLNLNNTVEGEITVEKVQSLDESYLRNTILTIKELDSIDVLIPLGLEIYLKSKPVDKYLKGFHKYINLQDIIYDMKTIDYHQEISYLTEVFFNIKKSGLLNIKKIEDIKQLNNEEVSKIFYNLGKLESINIVGTYVSEYMATTEVIKSYEDTYKVKPLKLNAVNWKSEMNNLNELYQIAYKILSNDFSEINERDIFDFANALFNSQIFSYNYEFVSNVLWNLIPLEYKDYIEIKAITYNDYINGLAFAKLIYDSKILETKVYDSLLNDEYINKMSEYASSSQLINENLSGILNYILVKNNLDFEINYPAGFSWKGEVGKKEIYAILSNLKTILSINENKEENVKKIESLSYTIFHSKLLGSNINNLIDFLIHENLKMDVHLDYSNLDYSKLESQQDFRDFINTFIAIYKTDFSSNDEFMNGLDYNSIREISYYASKSKLIQNNLNLIIDYYVQGLNLGIEVVLPNNPSQWTQKEISSILNSIKIINANKSDLFKLVQLNDEELSSFLDSKIITNSIIKYLQDLEFDINGLKLKVIANIPKESPLWLDSSNNSGELRKLYNAIKLLFKDSNNFNEINVRTLYNLSDGTIDTNNDQIVDDLDKDDFDKILESQVLCDTIINFIVDNSSDLAYQDTYFSIKTVINLRKDDARWYGSNGELRNIIQALKTVFPDYTLFEKETFDFNIFKDISTGLESPLDDDLSIILKSTIISDSLIELLKGLNRVTVYGTTLIVDVKSNEWKDSIDGEAGELRKLIHGLNIIIKNVDLNKFVFTKEVTKNIILNLTDGSKDTNGDGIINQLDSNEIDEISTSKIISDCVIQMFYESMKDKYEKDNKQPTN